MCSNVSFMVGRNGLSWICSTLTECHFRHFVPVNSICSLSGLTHFIRVVRTQIRSNLIRNFVSLVLVNIIPYYKRKNNKCHSSFYGGRRIKDTQWIATVESGERSFYVVQFEHQGADALAAIVCIAEGDVASTWEFHGNVDPATYKEGDSIWFVDDEGNFMPHAPEIHCIVATDQGLEIYVRIFGGESVQYHILREVGHTWLTLQKDYWIYVWD